MEKFAALRNFEFFKTKDLRHSFDPLTHVLNRETMKQYINSLISAKKPFSYFLIDVDNFKNVNDTYGHMSGDEVLFQTAHYMLEKIGTSGVVARYGGDEFMVVLEGVTDYDEVWAYGHKINMNIGTISFKGLKGLSLTVTTGISRYPIDADNFNDLMLVADKALYRGKMKGRNCFIIYLPAKHAHIDIKAEKAKNFSSMHLCARVFQNLMLTDSVEDGISEFLTRFCRYFMFDHICLETKSGMNFEVVHSLNKFKNFKHINIDDIDRLVGDRGFSCITKVELLDEDDCGKILSQLREQHVVSAMYSKIAAFGNDYGYIRVDMTDTGRIWQNTEMDVLIIAANTIGILLYYQNKCLEEMLLKPLVTVESSE